jgi:hypothetical protein
MRAVLQPHGFLWKVIWASNITVLVMNLVSGAPRLPLYLCNTHTPNPGITVP